MPGYARQSRNLTLTVRFTHLSSQMPARKRLLLLSHVLPYPPDSGVTSRTYNTVRQLQREFDVTLVMFTRRNHQPTAAALSDAEAAMATVVKTAYPAVPIPSQRSKARLVWDHLRSVLSRRSYTYFTFESEEYRAHLEQAMRNAAPDLIHLESLDLHRWLAVLPEVPVTATHHDLESLWLERRAEHTRGRVLRKYVSFQARLAHRTEIRLCPQLSANIVMSELDAQRLQELAPGSSTIVVPNGVDTDYFGLRTEQPIPGRIVFIGPTYLFPNRDAVDHLVTAIWPRVRHVLPHATLHLIGGGPPSLLSRYSSIPGVTALGRVPDVRPHVGAACCSVVPIRVGGGTRIKIVESWSMGRTVVSTSLGCEGLACTDDLHLLVRDNPAHFADAIIQLVQDDPRRLRLAAEGKRLVDERYSWNSIGSAMTQEYLRLISGG